MISDCPERSCHCSVRRRASAWPGGITAIKGMQKSRSAAMSELVSRSGPMPMSTSPENTRAITLSTAQSTKAQVHARVLRTKPGHQLGQQCAGEQLRHSHAHAAALQRLEVAYLADHAIQVVQDLLDLRIELARRVGQAQAARAAVEEAQAQGRLQLLDQAAQGRLGDEKPLGRQREAAGLGHRHEGTQLAQRHIHQMIL
ncbi:hypothetical protein ALISP_2609 [Alicycliphilus sp. B1]|nr:hypothetical protein ALISP_2609 [Alicycliphilus sp. B1]